jgi:hypothetical protein
MTALSSGSVDPAGRLKFTVLRVFIMLLITSGVISLRGLTVSVDKRFCFIELEGSLRGCGVVGG